MKRDPGQLAGSLLDIYFSLDHMESRSIAVETRRISTSPSWGKTGTSIASASCPFENCSDEVHTRADHQPQSTRLSPLFRAPEEELTASLSSSLGYCFLGLVNPASTYSVLFVAHQLLIALTFVNGWSLCQSKGIAMAAFLAVRLR
jgi:hypothetical protein